LEWKEALDFIGFKHQGSSALTTYNYHLIKKKNQVLYFSFIWYCRNFTSPPPVRISYGKNRKLTHSTKINDIRVLKALSTSGKNFRLNLWIRIETNASWSK